MEKVIKQELANGRIQYTFNGNVIRTSKKNFNYALVAISRQHENPTPFIVGLGNNPKNLKSSWSHIYAHWCDLYTIDTENK